MVESKATILSFLPKKDLESIEPFMNEQFSLIYTIKQEDIVEFKNNSQPTELFQLLANALLIMFGETDKEKINWPAVQNLMEDPHIFIERLKDFESVCLQLRPQVMEMLEPILSHPDFNPETMIKTSNTAAHLCWYVNNFAKVQKISQRVASQCSKYKSKVVPKHPLKVLAEKELEPADELLCKAEVELENLYLDALGNHDKYKEQMQ